MLLYLLALGLSQELKTALTANSSCFFGSAIGKSRSKCGDRLQ